jgi:UDP-N-acetylenolpyruvoylglucosamine reductase
MQEFFVKNFPKQTLFNEPMKNHTSFKIGGPADILFLPEKNSDVEIAVNFCKDNNIRFFVMGNGTNLLVSDDGFRGVIIKISKNMAFAKVNGNEIEASSGILLSRLSKIALENNLSNLEFASGIPGTLGGAICMNAGAYGGEIKDVFVSAEIFHDGQIKTFTDLNFSYRKSLIDENYIVLSAKIKLTNKNHDEILKKMTEYADKRRSTQPLEFPNAGSIFKRVQNNSAGKLIMDANLAGYTIGGACVSKKHCGFIINLGNAKAQDVLDLIDYVKKVVQDKFDVSLETEIKLLN